MFIYLLLINAAKVASGISSTCVAGSSCSSSSGFIHGNFDWVFLKLGRSRTAATEYL